MTAKERRQNKLDENFVKAKTAVSSLVSTFSSRAEALSWQMACEPIKHGMDMKLYPYVCESLVYVLMGQSLALSIFSEYPVCDDQEKSKKTAEIIEEMYVSYIKETVKTESGIKTASDYADVIKAARIYTNRWKSVSDRFLDLEKRREEAATMSVFLKVLRHG